ncbi:MAG: Hint domain [Cypionkella sp.]|uniref:Hint domain-containing protein n=1 Tax=Cypionkella sp. TaxID=2811411 RepID=UPI00261CBF98|nr:Hint domain-containing protein [Cypionkella sp.]MDB5658436.1 Hint domain [Cypionkella sp.]
MYKVVDSLISSSCSPPKYLAEGIAAGSLILTSNGLLTIEELERGSLLQTQDYGLLPLADVYSIAFDNDVVPQIMRISAGVLGAVQELYLGCAQHVALQHMLSAALFGVPTALIRIEALTSGDHVARATIEVQLYKIILTRRALIQVSGVWLSSHAADATEALPYPELEGSDATTAGECGIFVRKTGERHARPSKLEEAA